MKLKLTKALRSVRIASLLLSSTLFINAHAQTPTTTTIINAFPPGAVVDSAGRLIASSLEGLGNVVMENRPGAGGNIAANQIGRAAPNGHTLLFTAFSSLITAKAAGKADVIDLTKGLIPVANIGANTNLLLVRADLPIKSFSDLVGYAKAHPGKLNFGTNGVGGAYHLGLEQLNAAAGIKMTHVPYKGGGPAMQDMLGGRLDAMFATVALASPHLASSHVRAIAVANSHRTPQLPELPTIEESGLAGYRLDGGMGIFAPPGTPMQIVETINAAVNASLNQKPIADKLSKDGVQVTPMSSADFKAYLDQEVSNARTIIEQNQLTL